MAMPVLPDELAHELARRVRDSLARLGHAYTCRDGSVQRVRFRRIQVTRGGGFLLLEVDTERLPRGVRADELTSKQTLHHLTAVVHRPVRALNTTGIAYAVELERTAGRRKLPTKALLYDVLPRHPGTPLTFPVGEGLRGPTWVRLDELDGHFLVGGEPRSGKTTWLLAALLSLTLTNAPADLRLVLVDPKGVDFYPFGDSPHLARPIAVDPCDAEVAIAELVQELEERRKLFRAVGAERYATYNARAAQNLPYLVAVVDEVTVLVQESNLRGEMAANLVRLSSLGLTFGICLVLATQKPMARVIDTLARDNLAVRVAFQVTTPEHSRVILGQSGAEKLPRVRGRMLARLGDGCLQELQGYLLTKEDLAGPLERDPRALLDGEARRMLAYAVEHLGGRFPEREICRGLGVGQTQYRRARDKLLQAGILTRGEKNALVVAEGYVP